MLNDRRQKADVLRYLVAKRWFPQLELEVLPSTVTTKNDFLLTDIDVLGSMPDELEGFRTCVFDCKTGRRESPVSRALWLRGLMDKIHAERGFCLLDRPVERDHRLTAADLKILLLSEQDFPAFTQATDGTWRDADSHLARLENWETYFDIHRRFPALAPASKFSRSEFWITKSAGEACRRSIVCLRKLGPELDPSKSVHVAVVGDLLALFLHALGRIVTRLFSSYLQPNKREDLAEALLFLIYGGRSSYEFINELRSKVRRRGKQQADAPDGELTLPEWPRLVQLVRQTLDAPRQLLQSPLIAREVAWSYLTPSGPDAPDARPGHASVLAVDSPQAAKFCFFAAEYLVKAARLPPEFDQLLAQTFLNLQPLPASKPVEL